MPATEAPTINTDNCGGGWPPPHWSTGTFRRRPSCGRREIDTPREGPELGGAAKCTAGRVWGSVCVGGCACRALGQGRAVGCPELGWTCDFEEEKRNRSASQHAKVPRVHLSKSLGVGAIPRWAAAPSLGVSPWRSLCLICKSPPHHGAQKAELGAVGRRAAALPSQAHGPGQVPWPLERDQPHRLRLGRGGSWGTHSQE